MQPFDALTMRAALQEAKPLLLNRRVDKVYQLGRDEIVLALRLKTGPGHFLLSAQASFGRLCFINTPNLPKHGNPPAFCQLLRKHLTSAIIVDIQQLAGERVADFIFSCTDELGTKSIKVLTAEVMGRHSNLIFWDRESEKIIGASHVVTQEMSRQREVAPTLKYIRPPKQDKPNIFDCTQEQFNACWSKLGSNPEVATLEHWMVTEFAGIGRHLADELTAAAGLSDGLPSPTDTTSAERLWAKLAALQQVQHYRPAMRTDLTRYSVLSWWPELAGDGDVPDWQRFPAVNDMIEHYFKTLQLREQMQQLKDRIRSELKSEAEKLESRLAAAVKQLESTADLEQLKKFGDLILVNANAVTPGLTELQCDDLYATESGSGGNGGAKVTITINPNLNAAQNAQTYYRQFAKGRVRKQAASVAREDAAMRIEQLREYMRALDEAKGSEELNRLKELVLDRGKRSDQQRAPQPVGPGTKQQVRAMSGGYGGGPGGGGGAGGKGPRLMSTKSTDGWLIYIGRNRNENDVLLSKLAQPHDIWLHVQGQEGAHVLIKNPNKQDPPLSTVREAAQVCARFSKISLGSKVRVIYTHCKYVRKLGKDKPGMVRYENEKTIEVDTAAPMPASLRRLFAK
jgi:predicted ribosome quality control (RQC) complex YloA/Tae2 family protein